MAYGNTSELDIAATTYDTWVNAGNNAYDLMSAHNQFVAVLYQRSTETGDSFNFKQSAVAEGGRFKATVFGNTNANVTGITRANQVNAITPTVEALTTSLYYVWTHYQGTATSNYEDEAKNSGKAAVIDQAAAIKQRMIATYYNTLGIDMWDGADASISKIASVQSFLKNTATGGGTGVDQTDTANNSWFVANTDTNAEIFNFYTFDTLRDSCVHDTGVVTGITGDPDCAFMTGPLYAKARQDLKSAQRVEVSNTLAGGAKYLMYDGCRLFRETKMAAGECVILNSGTWLFRYKTKAPELMGGWLQDPNRPAIKTLPSNWFLGLGCISPKHNAYMSNKTGS